MARPARIVIVAPPASTTQGLIRGLRDAAFDVTRVDRPDAPGPRPPDPADFGSGRGDGSDADRGSGAEAEWPAAVPRSPDLVLVDAASWADVPGAVRACRRRWPAETTPVLVLGSPDPASAAAAIEAGATDSVVDSLHGPLLDAHVRRMLRAGESLRAMLGDERRRAQRESLAQAAADFALPLGEMLDELEAVMARTPVDERLDELLELTGRAVDAVDRLRRLATSAEEG